MSYEKSVKPPLQGDPGIESIYEWGASLSIPMRGATGTGDGVHVLTGPIYVRGAEKGDVLQVSHEAPLMLRLANMHCRQHTDTLLPCY